MNRVDALLKSPFSALSLEEKLQVKALGAHRPTDLKLDQNSKSQKRTYPLSWLHKKKWLTVSEEKKYIFCFVYIVF
jgi:hypothetical protein